ncbi:MAG: hypothetical protein K0M48_10360 [Thiobacillus sp.]|nr:hypothetical protein [Thiobacillus sp.]
MPQPGGFARLATQDKAGCDGDATICRIAICAVIAYRFGHMKVNVPAESVPGCRVSKPFRFSMEKI